MNIDKKTLDDFVSALFAGSRTRFAEVNINKGDLLMSVPETIGTLSLKIARLGHKLHVLEQQQVLSQAYPYHQSDLVHKYSKLRLQMETLSQQRQRLLHNEYTRQ